MAFLGDIITTGSRLKVDEIIKAKSNELARRFGLSKEEENIMATAMFVAVLQTEVVQVLDETSEELKQEIESLREELSMVNKYGPTDED